MFCKMTEEDFFSRMAIKIKTVRKKRGITREFMAEQLGMTVSGYSRIERGEVDLKVNKLLLIKDLLNCDWADLFDSAKKHVYYIGKDHQVESVEIGVDNLQLNYRSDYLDRYVALLEKRNRELESELKKYRDSQDLV